MVEMMAQAGCAVNALPLPENKGKIGFFGGIKEAKFRQPGKVPGDRLEDRGRDNQGKEVRIGVGKGGVLPLTAKRPLSAEITFAIND